MTPPAPPSVTVTQADREFASRWASLPQDHAPLARDAARHRTTAEAASAARIEGLTQERNFHRETADLHAESVAEAMAVIGELLAALAVDDDEGLMEHAEPVVRARALLAKHQQGEG